MFGLIFLSLLVMTAAVGGLGLMMFLDVAFCGAGGSCSPSATPRSAGRTTGRLDAADFVRRVEQSVSRVATGLGSDPPNGMCDSAGHPHSIHVTTPEVLAIVEELRDRFPSSRIESIRDRAQRNLTTATVTGNCPLLLAGGFCACAQARPIACRTRCIAGADSEVEARKLAESIGLSATRIFRDCLKASGQDDTQYELNQALVNVLRPESKLSPNA